MSFNVALLNRYNDGNHSLGYHADREEIDLTFTLTLALALTLTLGLALPLILTLTGFKSCL